MLESSFLQNEASVIKQTNGYKIRSFDPGVSSINPNVKTDFKTQFSKFLQPQFGLGYAIYENTGSFKVLIERYSHFYVDAEIDSIEKVQDGTFFIEYDKDLIFNEFDVGYSVIPKSTDENKENNLDEYNSRHLKLSPIQSVKKKAVYVSDYIASGYKIENQRREQFKDKPSDTVTDDETNFVIDSIYSDEYNYEGDISYDNGDASITFVEATFLNIQVGDAITVDPGSGGGVSNYTVKSVAVIGVDLVVVVNENVAGNTFNGVSITVTLPESRLRADRGDNTSVFDNVISKETSYNVGLNPVWMLKNHSDLFNSGFEPKPGTDKIKTSDVKLNSSMSVRAIGFYSYNSDTTQADMSEDIELNNINSYNKLFSGFRIKFTASMGYDRLLNIRNAYLNQGVNNYGYIKVLGSDGQYYSGYLMELKYSPLSEQADFVLRGKY